ncbi:MAG: hypothetical protein WCB12_07925 [Bryobacteraceae bacterium]
MAKLKPDPISAQDLADFVADESDFAFEMQVLRLLRAAGFNCSHSGTYRDPVTDKIRQFDIRAVKSQRYGTLALAVECKNIRPSNPILLSAVPRTEPEAFHSLLVLHQSTNYSYCEVQLRSGSQSRYRPGEMVGKRTDQVGRDTSEALVSNDEAAFEKLNQAVNSCQELVRQYADERFEPLRRAIVPVLVVPAGLLWQVDYDEDGAVAIAPRRVGSATLFYDHAWSTMPRGQGLISYRISHVEFVTAETLPDHANWLLGEVGFFPP